MTSQTSTLSTFSCFVFTRGFFGHFVIVFLTTADRNSNLRGTQVTFFFSTSKFTTTWISIVLVAVGHIWSVRKRLELLPSWCFTSTETTRLMGGGGEDWMGQGMRGQAHLPVHTAPELWDVGGRVNFSISILLLTFPKGCGLWARSCDFVHHFLLKH